MAGTPGYYISDPSELVVLPSELFGGLAARPTVGSGIQTENISLETPLGERWVVPRFTRWRASITFRLTPADMEILRQMDEDVDGDAIPFFYVPDVENVDSSGELVAFFCRKQNSFLPKQLDSPISVDGDIVAANDYVLDLLGEPERVSLTLVQAMQPVIAVAVPDATVSIAPTQPVFISDPIVWLDQPTSIAPSVAPFDSTVVCQAAVDELAGVTADVVASLTGAVFVVPAGTAQVTGTSVVTSGTTSTITVSFSWVG